MIQALLLAAIGGLLVSAKSFVPEGDLRQPAFSATLAFGFVLLSALLAGALSERLRIPRVTGYLLAGVIAGPYALGLLTEPMVFALGLVDGTAVCLIALTAGAELSFSKLKPYLGVVRAMTIWAVLGTTLLLTVTVLGLGSYLPWLGQLPLPARVAVAVVLGITLASQSPAVVMALLDETASDGPLSKTMLAVVVISDLVVIALFAVVSALAHATLGGQVDAMATVRGVAWELFGSMIVGAVIGPIMAVYLAKVREGHALFVLVVCVVVAEVGRRIHLDPLIVMLVVGVILENGTKQGAHELTEEIEEASLPVYAVFFAVAGAALRVDLLATVAVPATVLAVARAVGFWGGSQRAGRVSGAPDNVTRYTWVGLLPQAGLALALALILKRSFPDFGTDAALLVLSVVGINQIITPVLLRIALVRAGESGARHVSSLGVSASGRAPHSPPG